MKGQYDEMEALDASLDEFAALIESYNLKAVGIGAGVGGIGGIALPGLLRALPSGTPLWDWVRMLSPVLVTGIVGALVAKKQPVVAVALVASGSTLTCATLANKLFYKDVSSVGISLESNPGMLTTANQAAAAAANPLPNRGGAVAGLLGNDQDLPFGDTQLLLNGLGRIETLYASEDQANGLAGLSLVNEQQPDLSFMV